MTEQQPTPAKQWKTATKEVPLEVPSGNTALVRRLPGGRASLITDGLIPPELMPLFMDWASKKGQPPFSEEHIRPLMDLYDNVVLTCVVEPNVSPVPGPDEERDPDVLYIDDVDYEDRLFIFQWAMGGSADLEQFRQNLVTTEAEFVVRTVEESDG